MRERVTDFVTELQQSIVTKLESYGSGQIKFRREPWTRDEGGGGLSCTFPPLDTSPIDSKYLSFLLTRHLGHISAGHPIEKAGVNISMVNGILPPAAIQHMSTSHAALKDIHKSLPFFAAGLSLVIHPRHPRVPGVHANYRYFEVLDAPISPRDPNNSTDTNNDKEPSVIAWWFGVITDLTPAYVNEVDFCHFHSTLKNVCDAWSDTENSKVTLYPTFKASCDDYLFIPHRREHRGIGGVRFDDMDSDAMRTVLNRVAGGSSLSEDTIARLSDQAALFGLVKSLGNRFLPSFINILERRMHEPLVPSERRWQLLRRGRAVEFNLVADRGTRFGLSTPGIKIENVLVGMPPEARWEYCSDLESEDQETEEAEMMKVLKQPRNWV